MRRLTEDPPGTPVAASSSAQAIVSSNALSPQRSSMSCAVRQIPISGITPRKLRGRRRERFETRRGCVPRWWRDGADIDPREFRQADCRRVYLRRRARRRGHSPETCGRDRAAIRGAIPRTVASAQTAVGETTASTVNGEQRISAFWKIA